MAKNPKRPGGTPPKEHQFKPGQSGNPGGRPKGRRTMRKTIEEALERVVEAENKATRQMESMSLRTFMAMTILGQVQKDPELFIRLMKWLEGDGPPAARTETDAPVDDGFADDEAIIQSLLERELRRRASSEDDDV